MSGERRRDRDAETDGLLRTALADDLPAEVEAGMRARIARFRAERTEGASGEAHAFARAWLARRGLWAALSVLMLLAGLLLQGSKASTPLGERIAALKTEFASLDTTRR